MLNIQPVSENIETKVSEFTAAIKKYNHFSRYIKFERFVATTIIMLQLLSIASLVQTYHFQGSINFILSIFTAFVATDFVNGLAHMIIDNNVSYSSKPGPFIAAFHLHHFKIRYASKSILKIYFSESGQKFWLFIYLILLTLCQAYFNLNDNFELGLVAFGVLSSIAELSHYWCHNPPKNNYLISFLQKYRILLSLKHHRIHHTEDNKNYAFLNGMSNPLLNLIARHFFKGYKNRSDQHVAIYIKNHNL